MNDAIELKPCPCCGNKANILPYMEGNNDYAFFTFEIYCTHCHIHTDRIAELRAINIWNTRAIDERYLKLLNYVRELDKVSDYEYPFSEDNILRPEEILKELGEI